MGKLATAEPRPFKESLAKVNFVLENQNMPNKKDRDAIVVKHFAFVIICECNTYEVLCSEGVKRIAVVNHNPWHKAIDFPFLSHR